MSGLVFICASICAPLIAFGLYDLQARLEQWDYNRHIDD
jgi:hypothetical protein